MTGFPTSSDIYLEVDGTRVAVVQSYSAKAMYSRMLFLICVLHCTWV